MLFLTHRIVYRKCDLLIFCISPCVLGVYWKDFDSRAVAICGLWGKMSVPVLWWTLMVLALSKSNKKDSFQVSGHDLPSRACVAQRTCVENPPFIILKMTKGRLCGGEEENCFSLWEMSDTDWVNIRWEIECWSL